MQLVGWKIQYFEVVASLEWFWKVSLDDYPSDHPGVAFPLASMSWEVGYSPMNLIFLLITVDAVVRGTQRCLKKILKPLPLPWLSTVFFLSSSCNSQVQGGAHKDTKQGLFVASKQDERLMKSLKEPDTNYGQTLNLKHD